LCCRQWQVIEQREESSGGGAGDTEQQFVWSPVYVDAMVLRDRDSDANGSLDERLYAVHDANFNVTAVVGDDGSGGWEVVERYLYDPYGERTVLDADWSADANHDPGFAPRRSAEINGLEAQHAVDGRILTVGPELQAAAAMNVPTLVIEATVEGQHSR
jgi:hypothetical protein